MWVLLGRVLPVGKGVTYGLASWAAWSAREVTASGENNGMMRW